MKKSSEIILVAAVLLAGFVLPYVLCGDTSVHHTRVASQAAAPASAP